MKKCCFERQRRGPINHFVECGDACTKCLLAYYTDLLILELKDNKPVKAFERAQDVRRQIRELPSEA